MHKLIIILAISLGVVQAQTPFQRGDGVGVLLEQSPTAKAATVEAVPADRVEINSSGIYINDVAVTRLSAEFTASSPWQKCNFLNWDSRVSAKTEQC